jgi:hypothetical protein
MTDQDNESRTSKPRNWPLIVVIVITVLTIIVALGAKGTIRYFKAVQRTKLPYYSLEIYGDHLVFRTAQTGKVETLKTIAVLPKSDIVAAQHDQVVTIKVGRRTEIHGAVWRDGFAISPKNRAVFFKQSILTPASKSGPTSFNGYVLYRWDEKSGFTKLTPQLNHIMTVKLSLDEKTLFGTYYGGSAKPASGAFIYTIATRKIDYLTSPVLEGAVAMIDRDFVIVQVPVQKKDGSYRVEYRGYKLSVSSYLPFYVDATVQEVVAFNGSIWCRAESPGKQSILRLNKTFDKVEERIDFPAINQEP